MKKIPKHAVGSILLPAISGLAPEATAGISLGSGLGAMAGAVPAYAIAAAKKYNERMADLANQAHYSDRNADRMIRNIGQSSSSLPPVQFPAGHLGSPQNPIVLPEVTHTVEAIPSHNALYEYLYADEASDSVPATPSVEGPSQDSTTVISNPNQQSPAPNNDNPRNNEKPKSRFKRALDALRNKDIQTNQSAPTPTPTGNNQNGSFLGRILWETKNNNFGKNWWQWRNVGRIGLGLSYPAREHFWPTVGKGLKYMTIGPDSVSTPTLPIVSTTPSTTPIDSSYTVKGTNIAPTDTTFLETDKGGDLW